MKKHMKNVHETGRSTNKAICKVCGKSMKEQSMRQHLIIHEEKLKRPSHFEKCPICKKQYSFKDGKDLSMHMAKHELAKRYHLVKLKE